MFYRGIVKNYNTEEHKGCIVLLHNNRVLDFALSDFPNTNLVPQIGERVKCTIVENNGAEKIHLVVRLDHKNAFYFNNKKDIKALRKISEKEHQPETEDEADAEFYHQKLKRFPVASWSRT